MPARARCVWSKSELARQTCKLLAVPEQTAVPDTETVSCVLCYSYLCQAGERFVSPLGKGGGAVRFAMQEKVDVRAVCSCSSALLCVSCIA